MSTLNIKYVVITAARDEADNIATTIDCMLRQTIRPAEWVIVDDGSIDNTAQIIEGYAEKYIWIRLLRRPNRGFRKPGGGVVEAFNDGYNSLTQTNWDFVVKFDGDLSFQPDYFERCFRRFSDDPMLGIGGGTICYVSENDTQIEEVPAFHVRGATKIYRRECWEGLGGLWPAPGWDTADEIKANANGWRTRSFKELLLVHHRPTGTADGFWRVLVKYGRANYICGYDPLFMLCKCLLRLPRKPWVVGGVVLMYGYVSGYLKKIPQIDDPKAIAYIRRQQRNRLLGRESIWDEARQPSR
jgi:biofilm PGA synthesis N-glycosyltransferase PgaC